MRQWSHDVVYFTPPDILTAAERDQLNARAIGIIEGSGGELGDGRPGLLGGHVQVAGGDQLARERVVDGDGAARESPRGRGGRCAPCWPQCLLVNGNRSLHLPVEPLALTQA